MTSRNDGTPPWKRIGSTVLSALGLAGAAAHAQEPRLDGAELQARVEAWWRSDPGRPPGPNWYVTEVLGCVPAFDRTTRKPWPDHWVCVTRTSLPTFVARALVQVSGDDWKLIDLDGKPACPPLEESQAALRRITGLEKLKLGRELGGGESTLDNRRDLGGEGVHPWRIQCRYDSNIGSYDLYVWYENGQYAFDPADMRGYEVPRPHFTRRDEPSAAHLEALQKTAEAERQAAVLEDARIDAADAAAPGTDAWREWSTPGRRFKPAEANQQFKLTERMTYFDEKEKARVRVIEGDLTIDGDLLLDWEERFSSQGLVVTGDLTVTGAIVNANMNGGPFLLVGGKTRAHAIVGGGSQFIFEGDVHTDDIVLGHYNDGSMLFKANLKAPLVVRMDHAMDVMGKLDGRWSEGESWAEILDMRHPELAGMDENQWGGAGQGADPAAEGRQASAAGRSAACRDAIGAVRPRAGRCGRFVAMLDHSHRTNTQRKHGNERARRVRKAWFRWQNDIVGSP